MVCTNLQRTLYQNIHHQDMVYFLANRLSIDERRECIQIWLGTHSVKQEKNAPSRCRSSFPNGSVEKQQLDSS